MFNTATPRRWRRTILTVAALGAATALLAGCSGAGGSSGGGTTTITLSMQQTDVKTGDPTTWAIVQAFEKKYPKIKVTVTGQPVAQHDQAIDVAAQSHTLPSIFWLNSADVAAKLNKSGALLNLAPIMKKENVSSNFSAAALAPFKTGSTQFGLPYQALVTGLYYNKKILSDNGLTPPTTFADLLHISTVLHAKGITPIANGANQSAYAVWSFLTDLDRFGFDNQIKGILAGTTSFDNPDFLRFYTDLAQLQKAGAFSSDVANLTYNQAVSAYSNGKAAFLDSGVWAAGSLQTSAVGADTAFWAGPQFADGVGNQKIAMNVVGAPISASGSLKAGSPEYDAVSKFIGFYYGPDGQQIFADNGQPPVTTFSPKIASSATVFQSVLDGVKGVDVPLTQPDQYLSPASQNALYDSIFGVMEGQLTPKAAVDSVQKAITANKG
jgi:raffinose/stachyose/melibiose transport system substrate-binding protein